MEEWFGGDYDEEGQINSIMMESTNVNNQSFIAKFGSLIHECNRHYLSGILSQ